MNLKFYLLTSIVLAVIICLMTTAAYLLYRSDRQINQAMQAMAESLDKQLEVQLFRIDAGFGNPSGFPDLTLWKQSNNTSGVCVRFLAAQGGQSQSSCKGMALAEKSWPDGFEKLYRLIFNPESAVTRTVSFNRRIYGSVSIIPSVEMQLARAWDQVAALSALSAVTGSALCLLIYAMISRILRPAPIIIAGLEKMQAGDLTVRLPDFDIVEWQRTGTAINTLAAQQNQLLCQRRELSLKLITAQEQERRYLARELHDELGQCLAAVNALAVSIAQTAEQECPALLAETQQIGRINRHIMDTVRSLLLRLRPAGIDELGLAACLNGLFAEWQARSAGKIDYRLAITGDCGILPEPLPITLYRIVQEGLTNIAKHSTATTAAVALTISEQSADLTIADDGHTETLPSTENQGLGLAGIRERVAALGGRFRLDTGHPGGFTLTVTLPLRTARENQE